MPCSRHSRLSALVVVLPIVVAVLKIGSVVFRTSTPHRTGGIYSGELCVTIDIVMYQDVPFLTPSYQDDHRLSPKVHVKFQAFEYKQK
jgi:hypothetical protein